MAIRLINDQIIIHHYLPQRGELISHPSFITHKPSGKFLIVGFMEHIVSGMPIHPIVAEAVKQDVGIIYVCDKLPRNPVKHSNVIYLETGWTWFTHLLFYNPIAFRGVFAKSKAINLAKKFSTFTKYKIPIIESISDIKDFSESFEKSLNSILVEIMGGVGDNLLCIPSLKTLYEQGKKVSVLIYKRRKDIFKNLNYIDKVYFDKKEIDVTQFDKIIQLNFGCLLNDYRYDLNKQNRIYSIANVCGLSKDELTITKPQINLTEDEVKEAKEKVNLYRKPLFLGIDSDRTSGKMPIDYANSLIQELKKEGYSIFTSSLRKIDIKDCVNFSDNKLTTRQLFALINEMEAVVTMDTSFLHIAAAFNKPTVLLASSIRPEWRVSTYNNCKALKPLVKCYPCNAQQIHPPQDRECVIHKKLACIYSIPYKAITSLLNTTNFYNTAKKVLINRTSGLGDILMITSVINTLKKRDKNLSITFRTNHSELLKGNPNIDKLIQVPFKHLEDLNDFKFDYDKIIDLNYSVESKAVAGDYARISEEEYMNIPRIDLFYKQANVLMDDFPELLYTTYVKEKKFARQKLKKLKHKQTVLYVLHSTSPYRTYPIYNTLELLTSLVQQYNVIVVGQPYKLWGEVHRYVKKFRRLKKRLNSCYYLDLTDQTTIRQLSSLINTVDLTIAPDSGTLHIAGALKKPCIGLFGNINPKLRCSYYSSMVPLFKNLPCLCGDRFWKLKNFCPDTAEVEHPKIRKIGATCIKVIKAKEVLDLVNKVLLGKELFNKGKSLRSIKNFVSSFFYGKGLMLEDNVDLDSLYDKFNYIYAYNYLFQAKSKDKLLELLKKQFNLLTKHGYLIIHNKIPYFSKDNYEIKIHSYINLLYVETLLDKLNINYSKVLQIPLINKCEFLLVIKKDSD